MDFTRPFIYLVLADNIDPAYQPNVASIRKQELSYRKQIARQLHTQYVEGIYDNPVTLKPRLKVTGNWTIE